MKTKNKAQKVEAPRAAVPEILVLCGDAAPVKDGGARRRAPQVQQEMWPVERRGQSRLF